MIGIKNNLKTKLIYYFNLTHGDIKTQKPKNEMLNKTEILEKLPVTLHIKLLQYNSDDSGIKSAW